MDAKCTSGALDRSACDFANRLGSALFGLECLTEQPRELVLLGGIKWSGNHHVEANFGGDVDHIGRQPFFRLNT